VIDRHAWNFILMHELPFWSAKWSDWCFRCKSATNSISAIFKRQLSDLIGQYSAINLMGNLMDD